MYRRGLSTNTSYITYVSHNYKLQMCPDEAFVDMAATEQRSDIQNTYDITEVGDMLSQQMYRRDLLTSVGFITYKFHNTSTKKCVLKRALDLAKIEYYCDCAGFVGYLF